MRCLLVRLAPLAVLVTAASAQPATVSGVVRDAEGGPLPGVSVYLSGTTRGAAADREGRYRLGAVEPGRYRLVASLLGYTPAVQAVRLAPGAALTLDVVLTPDTATLAPITVEAQADRRWQRHLDRFRRALIGESSNADSTRILNPEVLDFRVRWGTLTATARAPLVIENRALGYRLHYDLQAFEASAGEVRYDGDEVFEPLVPASADQAMRWAAARWRAYRGSAPHLLRALLDGTAEAEGFTLTLARTDGYDRAGSEISMPTTGDRLIRRRDGQAWLTVSGRLGVTYHREAEEPAYLASEWFAERRARPESVQRSGLRVERGGAALDPDGTPLDPFAVSTSGYFAFERLADRVPRDFLPVAPEPSRHVD